MSLRIVLDDPGSEQVDALLAEHLREMHATSPPCSVHSLGPEALRAPEVSFWTIWEGDMLAGCAALKQLDARHGEIKSMRTAAGFLRRGVASRMLQHLIDEARSRAYTRLSLETGTTPNFTPARELYEKFGFRECPPFADYQLDPFSLFMTRSLVPPA